MQKVDKKALAKAIARRVRTRREVVGLSQSQLAEACGMSQQGVDNIEQAKVARPRNLLELAIALQTSPQWLQYGQGPEVVRPYNPVEEILGVLKSVDQDKLGAVLQFVRSLQDSSTKAA